MIPDVIQPSLELTILDNTFGKRVDFPIMIFINKSATFSISLDAWKTGFGNLNPSI